MSALLRLYPGAWRERYGDELFAFLDQRPPSLSDRIDLVRGALDARLHPQVRGGPSTDGSAPEVRRKLGLVAAIGGIAWIVGIVSVLVLPRTFYDEPDQSLTMIGIVLGISLIGIAVGELGTDPASPSSQSRGHAIAAISLVFGIAVFLGAAEVVPWPIALLGFFGFPVLGSLAVARASRNGVLPGWFVAVFAVLAVATIAGGLGGTNSAFGPALISVLGFGGLLLGALTLGGSSRGTNMRGAA